MKTFLKAFKERQGGFTLVELMVVVAIIGLLSSVALPNFRKYQAKSKISEAKLQLASLYTAESAFFSDFNIYAQCLSYMGYNPEPERPQRYFAIGFEGNATIVDDAWTSARNSGLQVNGGGSLEHCGEAAQVVLQPDGSGAVTPVPGAGYYSWFPAGKGTGNSIIRVATEEYMQDFTFLGDQATSNSTVAETATVSAGMTYRAGAAGIVDGNYTEPNNSALLTIDNNKRVVVRRNGY